MSVFVILNLQLDSEGLNHLPTAPLGSVYISEGKIVHIFFSLTQTTLFDQPCTYCKAPVLVNGFFTRPL